MKQCNNKVNLHSLSILDYTSVRENHYCQKYSSGTFRPPRNGGLLSRKIGTHLFLDICDPNDAL